MWEELYETHRPELLRYALAACKNPTEAEDVTQEVFLKALQNCDTFEDLGPSQRRAWLYRALKNALCDRYRHAAVEGQYLQTLPEEASCLDPGLQDVENALLLARLSPQDRTLFTLRYLENYTAQEISQMLNIPAGTIRSRLSRCRAQLKAQLYEHDETGGIELCPKN